MSVPALAIFGIIVAGLINEPWLMLMGIVYLLPMPWSVCHYAEKKKSLAEGVKDPDAADQDD